MSSKSCSSSLALLFFCLCLLAAMPSFADDLAVQIITDPDLDVLPMEVEFSTDVSGGIPPYSYVWSFGDGGTSSNESESHYYRESGTYQVRLAVFDSDGLSKTGQETIHVSAGQFQTNNIESTIYSNLDNCRSISQDPENPDVFWMATGGGLVKYDTASDEYIVFSNQMPSSTRAVVCADSSVWVATGAGLYELDADTQQFTQYNMDNSPLGTNDVRSLLFEQPDSLWIGNSSGVVRIQLSTRQWSTFNSSSGHPFQSVEALSMDSDGRLVIGTDFNGLYRFNYSEDSWRVYNTDLPHNQVQCIVMDGNGNIWVGTPAGLVKIAPSWNEWNVFNSSNCDMPSDWVLSLLASTDGKIWAGTYDGGVACFENPDGEWEIYNSLNSGLLDGLADTIIEDSNGSIWAGVSLGACVFDKDSETWQTGAHIVSELPNNAINAVLYASDDTVWIGTSLGLAHLDYNNNEWEVFKKGDSQLPGKRVVDIIQADDQSIWAALNESIARIDSETSDWTIYNDENSVLTDGIISSLFESNDHKIWVATFEGLYSYDPTNKDWNQYNTSNSDLPGDTVSCVDQMEDQTLWVGTNNGLAQFDEDADLWTIYNTDTSDIPGNWINDICEGEDGVMWVSTGDGLGCFNRKTNQWTNFQTDNCPLPSNAIYDIVLDDGNALWVGTYKGLARYDINRSSWDVITTDDHLLPENDIVSLSLEDSDVLWVGTYYGLARLSLPNQTKSPGRLVLAAGGGAASTNTLWPATQEIAESVYRIFHARGFKNTDIYFMSPDKWCDFNGDGFDDHIVDCPASNEDRDPAVSDVEYAITDWAATNYTEDTPLFVYLIDHGYPDDGVNGPYFQVAPGENLYASQLDAMLDAYEAATGGQVVVINESCYSGEFLSHLKKEGRVIISSTDSSLAQYSARGENCFSQYFLKNLYNNSSLDQAFSRAVSQLKISEITEDQTPQMDDDGNGVSDASDGLLASTIKLGGDFTLGAPWPEIQSVEQSAIISGGMVFTAAVSARMQRVWATVQPPGYEVDETGDYGKVDLPFFNLNDPEGNLSYIASYDDFTQTGVYTVTIYAKDQFGNVAGADPISIPVGLEGKGNVTGYVQPQVFGQGGILVSTEKGYLTVKVVGTDLEAQVGADGRYTIVGVAPGIYTLEISGDFFLTTTIDGVMVSADQTTSIQTVDLPLLSGSDEVSGDVDGNGVRGLPDALYILQDVSGKR
ncbi:two component regulator propeller domain protein [Desulfatibacillum aliphaticivorans]|uniref:Two component regulator propeller domain protein n=1 Tax=Desulfatibacillum aliphaticivorans TaxID=218208 RepID=B8FF09_DESAL|nr:two-component regulator propeller domain-containing protein [Desulfatibacillum aliphaticivorans]ACL03826.1 two component regulator propeller domain protein [Desulfatibacillum aliphaticivorans]